MVKEKPLVVVNKIIGRKIKQIREESGISQEKLGEMVGVTYQQIQKYENGVNRVSAEKLSKIADALKTPVDFFFENVKGLSHPPEKKDTASKKPLTIMEQELLDCFRLLPDKNAKTNLIGLLRSVSKKKSVS